MKSYGWPDMGWVGLGCDFILITINHTLPYLQFIIAISLLAVLALLSQVILLLQLSFTSAQKWKSLTLVLVLPLFVVSIRLTGWMFHTLYPRTTLHAAQTQSSDM